MLVFIALNLVDGRSVRYPKLQCSTEAFFALPGKRR